MVARGWSRRSAARRGAPSIVVISVAAHSARPSWCAAPQRTWSRRKPRRAWPPGPRMPLSTSPSRRRLPRRSSVASACRLDTGCDVIRVLPAVKLYSLVSSIHAVAGGVDRAHVGVSGASVTDVGAAGDRCAARSHLGPSTGGRGEQAQPGCVDYAVAAERGLCGDIGVPTRQASSAALTLIGRGDRAGACVTTTGTAR